MDDFFNDDELEITELPEREEMAITIAAGGGGLLGGLLEFLIGA